MAVGGTEGHSILSFVNVFIFVVFDLDICRRGCPVTVW